MRCKHGCRATNFVLIGLLVALSQTQSYAQIDPTARPVIGEAEINANDVYVRSGDSLNHYTIIKLKAGDKISVVGERGDWYEILPPEGTFSLISGDYVDSADNQKGIVNGANVRVRAGSLLNDNKYTVQAMLNKGAEVTILGKNPDGFLRIKPPPGATLWINKSYANMGGATGQAVPRPQESASAPEKESTGKTPTSGEAVSASSGDKPPAPAPRTPTSSAESEAQLRKLSELDTALTKEYSKPAGQRNLDSFLSQYRTIQADAKDEVLQQYAQRRIEEVQTAIEATGSIGHWRKIEEIAEAKRREFRTARAAIPEPPPAAPTIEAKGQLRASALFPPGSTPERYRLIDPATAGERTIAYVEIPPGSSIRVNEFLNKYVGVRALERRVQTGGVNPIPIYIADDLVLLEPPDAQSNALSNP